MQQRLDAALLALLDATRHGFHSRLREHDLSIQQAITLRMLSHPTSMRTLAQWQVCDASNITGIADRLEERGLLERRLDPNDRRVKLLALTAEGVRVRSDLEVHVSALAGFGSLGVPEREQLAELLERLVGTVGTEPGAGR